jgi:hypothetical protein
LATSRKINVKGAGLIKLVSLVVFLGTSAVICLLVLLPEDFFTPREKQYRISRVIEPDMSNMGNVNGEGAASGDLGRMVYENSLKPAIDLREGEVEIATITEDFDSDGADEQIVAYRNLTEKDNPIYITYIDYDETSKTFKRFWSAPTYITKQGTLSLYTMDLTGDHCNDIIVTGMNQNDEQAFSVFKLSQDSRTPYKVIAHIVVDGSVSVLETERSQAYQFGFANGASFSIVDRRRDTTSGNALDQIESRYIYNTVKDAYDKTSSVRIPGAQIEAEQVRNLLSGDKHNFEQFIDGLWYHVSDEGTVDDDQYIYFDTASRELIFYNDNAQQVYKWQTSYPTRYGMYISSQNISVPSLERKITLELESLESVRVRVSEDVRMRIVMNAPWDGSYRKASAAHRTHENNTMISAHIDAEFNSPIGRILFSKDGTYHIDLNGDIREGKYTFFPLEDSELLELISNESLAKYYTPTQNRNIQNKGDEHKMYKVTRGEEDGESQITLVCVRLSTNGIKELSEPPVPLSPVRN